MQETQEVTKQSSPLLLFKILRPRQWTKNLIAFAPLLFAGRMGETDSLIGTAFCTICLCLISGAMYILNDIKDRESDARHPVKKLRPIAAGRVSPKTALVVAGVAMLVGLVGGFLVRPVVGLGLLLYVVLQLVYNYRLKSYAILDVFCIAAGFVLRAACGGAAAHVTLSGWFLICTSLGALFLAIEKRRQELLTLGDDAKAHRKSFEKYSLPLIDRMEAVVVPSLVTSYCIYCFFSPSSHWMLLTAPFVLFGVLRYQLLSTSESSTGAPEEVLLRDRSIQICIILWVAISAGVVHGWIPEAITAVVSGVDALSVFSK
ncbi:MAG: decaprenyl-phosphate phosphoribosyltransferase [Candidatus Melainabacteria bacterium]|nr:decaprenyl-phosphate phosphoribosyltransferase [Candidatus Melainabacteria bacterium]